MSHELGTEARVIQDLRAEITKREKNDYDFSNETFFYQEDPHLLPNCRFGCSQTTAKRVSGEIAYESVENFAMLNFSSPLPFTSANAMSFL